MEEGVKWSPRFRLLTFQRFVGNAGDLERTLSSFSYESHRWDGQVHVAVFCVRKCSML